MIQDVSTALAAIYDASLDQEKWPAAARIVGDAFRGEAAICIQNSKCEPAGVVGHTVAERDATRYLDHFHTVNDHLKSVVSLGEGAFATHGAGARGAGTRADSFDSSEFYNDYLRPQGLYQGANALVLAQSGLFFTLSLYRERDAGDYSEAELAALSLLLPHLQRALRIQEKTRAAEMKSLAMEQAVAQMDMPLLLLDRTARLVYANGPAEALLRQRSGIRVRNGILCGDTQAASQTLLKHVSEMAGTLHLSRPESPRPLTAWLAPYTASWVGRPSQRLVMMLIHDPEKQVQLDAQSIAVCYGLTQSEVALLRALVEGANLADYARTNAVSRNTAKFHAANLYEKLGVHSQTDLIRLVLCDPVLRLGQAARRVSGR